MGEGISTDHRFIGRNQDAEQVGYQTAGTVQFVCVDAGGYAKKVRTRADGHDDFFQRGVARPLADSIDGAFHLTGAVANASQRVGNRHSQVVVAVNTDGGLLDVPDVVANASY